MADVDIDLFGGAESPTSGEHESRPDENITLPLVTTVGGPTWEPEHEQETSFRGESHTTKLMKDYVKDIYKKLSENIGETPEAFHFDYFKLEDGELYYRGNRKPLTTKGELKSVGMIADILGKNRLRNLGFDIPRGKVTAWEAVMLNEVTEKLPSESDVDKADDIEIQEIAENAMRSMENLNQQLEGEDLPMQELLGLDKQLRSIRGLLKVEVAKKVQLEEHIKKEHQKLEEFQEYLGVYDDAMKEDITKRTDKLNDELKVRQESINLLKGRLKNQITSYKETITKVLDKDTSLAEKIPMLFREQGIMIASVLMTIRMAIGVLVEALMPGGGGTATSPPPPKDEKGLKEWIRNKLKALESLQGKLSVKAAEALPGFNGAIISWVLNRAKDVVGWVLQNLWALVIGIVGLLYMYMVTKK